MKRKVDVAVISDTHLGTYGCHAKELLDYLRSIEPDMLILNGDIIDIWNLSKSYFPKAHMQVIRHILKMAEKGCKVYYITGNHDEMLRKYEGTKIGNVQLEDKLILALDGKIIWFFHGDVFDSTTKGWAKVIAKLGGKGYDLLILFNRFVNKILNYFGKEKMSLSKKIKSGVKHAVKWISNFETTAAELAIDQEYDVVVCGHIHQPLKKVISNKAGSVLYMNSGDWVENCTALEYMAGEWTIYTYDKVDYEGQSEADEPKKANLMEALTHFEEPVLFYNAKSVEI
ncbi:MAG: UDP-2,3-diacylglucosamine diphosphatase [Saprospiraceae bacterium]|nr:UDP-2,3-diacylglucosamine diphosphatase [Saprospiraceae bacterium]